MIQITVLDCIADAALISSVIAKSKQIAQPLLKQFNETYIALEKYEDKLARKYFRRELDSGSLKIPVSRYLGKITEQKVQAAFNKNYHRVVNARTLLGVPALSMWNNAEVTEYQSLKSNHDQICQQILNKVSAYMSEIGIQSEKVPFSKRQDEDYIFHGGYSGGDLLDQILSQFRSMAKATDGSQSTLSR